MKTSKEDIKAAIDAGYCYLKDHGKWFVGREEPDGAGIRIRRLAGPFTTPRQARWEMVRLHRWTP